MLTYKLKSDSLVDYLLDRCVNQIKFSLKVHWLINSYHESETNPKIAKLFENLLQKIEVTLVNGRRCTASNYSQYQMIAKNQTEEIYHQSIEKEIRQIYFDKCIEFYLKLKEMCEKLKSFPKESDRPNNRNTILKSYIFMFNANIRELKSSLKLEENFKNSIARNFYKGVILPFDDSFSTMDEHNSIIVRMLPEHSFCFSTKARVPVKISAECIRVIECFKWDELYLEVRRRGSLVQQDNIEMMITKLEEDESSNNRNNTNEDLPLKHTYSQEMTKSLELYMKEIKDNLTDKTQENSNHQVEEDYSLIDFNSDIVNPFGRIWADACKDIKETSPFRNFETYSIKNFIAKADDDLRQELMTMQLIKKFNEIFQYAEIPLKIKPYEILITSTSSGLIEFLPNTNSIDGIKKKLPSYWNLNKFFRSFFLDSFEEAQKNFAESLAAYSLLSYFIQIKDRHNGNLLIDMKGHLIHIDFGFVLGISPGNLNFESAPFKLTSEYVEILDGFDSPIFEYYKSLMLRGMMEAKKHVDSLTKIIEIMSKGRIIIIITNRFEDALF